MTDAPGTISVTSQNSSLFFMSPGFLPRTMITGRMSWWSAPRHPTSPTIELSLRGDSYDLMTSGG